MNLAVQIGINVKNQRTALGITQKELAEASGRSIKFISQLEGGTANATVGALEYIAEGLELRVMDLVQQGKRTKAKKIPVPKQAAEVAGLEKAVRELKKLLAEAKTK